MLPTRQFWYHLPLTYCAAGVLYDRAVLWGWKSHGGRKDVVLVHKLFVPHGFRSACNTSQGVLQSTVHMHATTYYTFASAWVILRYDTVGTADLVVIRETGDFIFIFIFSKGPIPGVGVD